MKITEKDKKLIIIFAMFLVVIGFYKFIFIPQTNKLTALKQEKLTYEEKINNINSYIALIGKSQKDIKIVKTKISDKTIKLFPEILQEKVIVDLDEMINSSKLEANSITFSDGSTKEISSGKTTQTEEVVSNKLEELIKEYKSTSNESKEKPKVIIPNAETQDSVQAYNTTVLINFTGSFDNTIELIKNIENYSKKLKIASVTLSQAENKKLQGIINLNFYGVPKLNNEDEEFLKWDFKIPSGKINPFDDIIGNVKTIKPTSKTVKQTIKTNAAFDFVMSSMSINSDLPTVMLGRAMDNDKESYIYSDNEKNENVIIEVYKKGNKYYYKYSAGNDLYPRTGEMEFTSKGKDIQMQIFSSARLNSKDLAGANITVNNDTDKKFIISIVNDDKTNPRIKVLNPGNKVIVNKK